MDKKKMIDTSKHLPIKVKGKIHNGKMILTNKKGIKKEWIPKGLFDHIFEQHENSELFIEIRVYPIGD